MLNVDERLSLVEMGLVQVNTEVKVLRGLLHGKDDDQHRVWNDMQDEVRASITTIDAHLDRQDQRFEKLESDVSGLKTDVSVLKTDVSVLKTDVSVLKSDVSELKTEVSVLNKRVLSMMVLLKEALERLPEA